MDSFISLPGGGNGNPLQYSCLENHMERGAWWVTVHGVVQSWTWLKWLSTVVCQAKGDTSGSCLEKLCLNPRGFDEGFFFFNFYFYFILLYNTILVLPYIDMNPAWVYIKNWLDFPKLPVRREWQRVCTVWMVHSCPQQHCALAINQVEKTCNLSGILRENGWFSDHPSPEMKFRLDWPCHTWTVHDQGAEEGHPCVPRGF